MSAGVKFVKHLRRVLTNRKALSGTAATLIATSVGLKWNEWSSKKKDKIVFLTKEENDKPSTAEIGSQQTRDYREDPFLPNGDINWACSCIEHDVIGPCNTQYRALREFMHSNKITEDLSELTEEQHKTFDKVLEGYIGCTMDYPVYYKGNLLQEEIEEMEQEKKAKLETEERKRKDKEENTRHFGKDTVLFLSEEENKIPSTVNIPTRNDLEEYRDPLLPDGTLNWACGCIERDVVGPCNIEFRVFRQFIHDSKGYREEMPIEIQEQLHNIIGNFLGCARKHPVYYNYDKLFGGKNDDDDDNGNGDSTDVLDDMESTQ